MQAQLDAGRGAFLMGAHLGSFEIIASVGRRQPGLHVSMAMYEHNAQKINAMLAAIGRRARPDIIPLGQIDAMLRIADRLDEGAFVGVLGDRTLGEEPVHRVMLLGREAWLPTGPMRAAAILRRPVIFTAGLYRGRQPLSRGLRADTADFSNIRPRGEREAEVHRAIERYAGLLDRYCRSDPFNWFNFFDFWRGQADKPDAWRSPLGCGAGCAVLAPGRRPPRRRRFRRSPRAHGACSRREGTARWDFVETALSRCSSGRTNPTG